MRMDDLTMRGVAWRGVAWRIGLSQAFTDSQYPKSGHGDYAVYGAMASKPHGLGCCAILDVRVKYNRHSTP